MGWLAEKLGLDRLLQAEVILPTDEYFPEEYRGAEDDARRIMKQLCDVMGLEAGKLQLVIAPDETMPEAAGYYHGGAQPFIRVKQSQLHKPENLTATLAHELAHEILLGGGLLTADLPDHEWITDLLPAYLGLGIFAANSVMHEKYWTDGQLSYWQMGRQGYLPARIFGYAFALFIYMRREDVPDWIKQLRLDAANALLAGRRFLEKSGDTLFHPDTIRHVGKPLSVAELTARLASPSASCRMAALWDLKPLGPAAAEAVPAMIRCLQDRDPEMPGEAALALAALGPAAAVAAPDLRGLLWHPAPATRKCAAYALGRLHADAERDIPELIASLRGNSPTVLEAVVTALRQYGPPAKAAVPHLLNTLGPALVDCDHALLDSVLTTLLYVLPDAERRVASYLADDAELRELALSALRDLQEGGSDDDAASQHRNGLSIRGE
ncbi:MAG: HEAT repeat domain-containing protein [Planctomycetia bacterium]|nr:HEAT repeat domain-containing protein [Planctomycetia bacterium]